MLNTLPPLIEDLSLAYRFLPARAHPAGLLILLHGVGSNETALAGLATAMPEELAIALVRSPLPMGPHAYCAFAVNFSAGGPVIDAPAAEASRLRLIKFIDELQQRTGLAANRTWLAGFSQGGIMAASLALTSPASVAGFAILSGRILPEIAPRIARPEQLAHLQALIVHGEHDATLPASWAERSHLLLKELGVSCTDRRYPAGHEITREMAQDIVAWVSHVLGLNNG